MYYENKSSFYIRQYGPVVAVIAFSVMLIASGVYIYIKSSHTTEKANTQVVANADVKKEDTNKQDDQNDKKEQVKENVSENKDTSSAKTANTNSTLDSLKFLQKSSEGVVENVKNTGAITVKIGNDSTEIYLIGIDLSNSPADTMDKVLTDLKGKKVKIAFDVAKQEDSKNYAYLYINDNTLYNEAMLKNGMAILRVERKNINMLDVLLKAEQDAKIKGIGIWKI